jgi:predicted enzyme related to lactoylglutathione lyase
MDKPLFIKVDAVLLKVPDIDLALAFYRDGLGMQLCWRKHEMAALRLGDAELVISTTHSSETDILVESVPEAVTVIEQAGGSTIVPPTDFEVGILAVISDPFGNRLTLIDLSKGVYQTDDQGNVTGVA